MKTPLTNGPARRPTLIHRLHLLAGGFLFLSATANAEVKLTFDSDAQGFAGSYNTGGTENPLHGAVWSPEFGGSVAITTSPGFYFGLSEININNNLLLQAELQNAIANGGTIKFKVRVRQQDFQGANPGYFQGLAVGNSEAGFDGDTGFGINTPFPINGTEVTEVVIPIYNRTVVEGVQSPPGGNGSIDYQLNSDYASFLIGLNSGGDGFTSGTIYIDDFTIDGAPPPPAPAAGTYTFDENTEGFGVTFSNAPAPFFSPKFGGTLALPSLNTDFQFFCNKGNHTGNELAKLRACAVNGGTISFDVIAPTGYLANRGIISVLQNQTNYNFSQTNTIITPASVQTLPGGFEIAKVVTNASDYPGLIDSGGYNFLIAYGGFDPNPFTVYLDNVTFLPNPGNGSKLTFDGSVQNLTATPSAVTLDSTGSAVLLTNPVGTIWGADGVFTAASTDTQVAATHTALTRAAVKGGFLKLKVTQSLLDNRTPDFTGVDISLALLGAVTRQEQTPGVIGLADFTEGGSAPEEEPVVPPFFTASTFSRTFTIPLYQPGSTETDGFVLEADAAQYAFQIGTGSVGVDSVNITFDDFEVVVKPDLEIVYTPFLGSGPEGFVGRLITNAEAGATYSATGLPPGITIDPVTGLISGIPTLDGTYNIVFTVSQDGVSVSTDSIQWVVITGAIPVITSFTGSSFAAVVTWANTGSTPVIVQRSTTLEVGSWTNVSVNDTDFTFTDFESPDGKAFYRVVAP